jgi:polysaccharide pyruvyl transferase CsaB
MKQRKRVIISGYYGFNNSGDDAILKAIVKDLKNGCKDIDITVFSNNPQSTEEIYGIKAVNRLNIISVIKGIYKSDMLISGGGSLLQDITSTRSIIYYLAVMKIAKLFKKPVMVYANGIGPINKKLNRVLTRKILNKVDLITLRDFNSEKTLDEIEVKNNIYVTADPVFTLEPSDKERVNDILVKEGIPTDKPLVGISVRNWKNSDKLKKVVSEAIDYIINNYDARVVLIPMHYPEDLEISNEIASRASQADCHVLQDNYSVEDIMGIINKLELIIAMRLHSLIYAATQAIPMIGLVYDPKVNGLLELIGVDSKCDVDKLELVELCTTIEKTWNNKENIKEELYKVREQLKKKALNNIEMALHILKSR